MRTGSPRGVSLAWAAVALLNLALAVGLAMLAPSQVGTTGDRLGYEYVGQHPLEPNCPHSIFCYRVLVPALLEHVPLDPVARWRLFAVVAGALTGVVLAACTGRLRAGVLASILAQGSFGLTFALYDPFTPDPAVYLSSAIVGFAWLRDRPALALPVALVGVFAKETVVLPLAACAIASLIERRQRRAWVGLALVGAVMVAGFHVIMNVAAGWSEAGSGSADLLGGSWLGRWLADPSLTASARLFYAFVPFGFGWLFAVLGWPLATQRLRYLAIGTLVLLPALVYVQTVERALSTAIFVVVPLAALFLARAPLAAGLAAAVLNALLTTRVGLSIALLPPVPWLLALAGLAAVAVGLSQRWAPAPDAPVPAGRTAPSG